MKRRLFLKGVTAVSAASVLGIRGGFASGKRIEYGLLKLNHSAPGIIPDHFGWFKEAGLDVKVSVFTTGRPIVEGLAAGQLDVAGCGTTPALTSIARGVKAQMIFGQHTRGTSIISRPEIKNVMDLKGKRVGLPAKGTVAHFVLSGALEKNGLALEDVNVLEIRDPLSIKISLLKGEIAAASVWEPFAAEMELASKDYKVLVHGSDLWGDYQEDVTLMSTAFIKERTEDARRFIDAHLRAYSWINDPKNFDALVGITRPLSGVSMEAERLGLSRMVFTPTINKPDIDFQINLLVKTGLLEKSRVPAWSAMLNDNLYEYTLKQWSAMKKG